MAAGEDSSDDVSPEDSSFDDMTDNPSDEEALVNTKEVFGVHLE